MTFILVIWVVHLLEMVMGWDLVYYGTYPLKLFGLKGILFMPLIHSGFPHLIHNTIPFLVLGTMMYYFYPKVAFKSIAMIYVLSGIGVWLFARPSYHIGASGVVYGMMAFVIGTGIFRKNIKSVALAFIVFLLYSGMLAGLFPGQVGVSHEGHLSGAVVGLFAAFFYKLEIEEDEIPETYDPVIPRSERPYFLPRDIFEKTRQERYLEEMERQRLAALERQRRLEEIRRQQEEEGDDDDEVYH